ncbi:MAG: L-aspartate oxidase [Acidimicrobiia bacterium]|nr:L-aspartate oxidase [Acidimicrobiia bacterium]
MRYPFDRLIRADAVVVGSGIGGLTAALAMAPRRVLVITKGDPGGGSTPWAQGGIAAAVAADDSPAEHAADTVSVGGGLNDPKAVKVLTSAAPERVAALEAIGVHFDADVEGHLLLGREGGHHRRRVLHSGGDATGAEMMRALVRAAAGADHVETLPFAFAADLVTDGGRVAGVTARTDEGEKVLALAPAVVLATGGIGRLYANTTNPPEVTGDGLAMAARAGARLADLEFVQFHPTALASGRDPMALLTEALRGEGAVLVDDDGRRFMVEVHPDAELAPRDVVARAIWARLQAGGRVFLDATAAVGASFPERFPTVFSLCLEDGIDPQTQPVPVAPAAHYHMGGVATDLEGRTSLPGLWAVGEVSCTGVHGANRLASNSLLEATVFGHRAGQSVRAAAAPAVEATAAFAAADPGPAPGDVSGPVADLRRTMWDQVGLVRNGGGLTSALEHLDELALLLPFGASEARNMVDAGRLIARAALARPESRGAHYRSDFPAPDPAWAAREPVGA